MIDLLGVYVCPKHGDVLSDQTENIEIIDTDRDDVWTEKTHTGCGLSVTRKVVDGVECFQEVDHERWLWATGYYDEPDEDDDWEEE